MKLIKTVLSLGKGVEPSPIEDTWVVYGKVEGQEVFSTKELTVYSGAEVSIEDTGAYGVIVLQGHGKMNGIDIESPAMIRYGDLTRDEYFVPYPTANAGVMQPPILQSQSGQHSDESKPSAEFMPVCWE